MSKWERVKLGEVCTKITDGSHNPPQGIECSEYLMLSSKNIYNNEITLSEPRYLSKDQYEFENKRTEIQTGDVLMTIVGTIGRVAVVPNNFYPITLQRSVAVLHPNRELIDSQFLMFSLRSQQKILEGVARGVAQKGIYLKQVKEITILFPALEVQKKIAQTLDTASELIALRKKQLAELDNLIKATFYDMFGDPVINEKGWETKIVNDVCEKILGGGTPSKQKPEYYIGDIPWVTPKDMKSILINDSIDHINENAIMNSSAKLIPAKSILMVIRSGILKRVLPVAINSVDVAVNQDMKAFITNENVSVEYLLYFFIMIQKDLLKNVRAVTADNIEFSLIKNTIVPTPPLVLQKKFGSIVAIIEQQKLLVQKAIDESQYFFDSLMAEYFE